MAATNATKVPGLKRSCADRLEASQITAATARAASTWTSGTFSALMRTVRMVLARRSSVIVAKRCASWACVPKILISRTPARLSSMAPVMAPAPSCIASLPPRSFLLATVINQATMGAMAKINRVSSHAV